jgi:tripartite-type tricarboxylate transporter receptor subunit TctC
MSKIRGARTALRLPSFGVLALAAGAVFAQGYPARPITMVVPFPAGGGTDVLARILTQKMTTALGQSFVIDNKPGAGGSIAAEGVAKAAPDGYTLMLATNSTQSIGPLLSPRPTYNPQSDFTPIAYVGTAPRLLLVNKGVPAHSVRELITLARTRPGILNYASNGVGTITHLTTELFKNETGIAMEHIAYKGTTLALADLIAGQVHLIFESIVTGLPHVKSGKLRGLAITSQKRSGLAPEIPTMAEAGVRAFEASTWFGVFGPRALPEAIVARLNGEVNKALADREVLDRLGQLGTDPGGGAPADLAAIVAADTARWARVIRERKITAQP